MGALNPSPRRLFSRTSLQLLAAVTAVVVSRNADAEEAAGHENAPLDHSVIIGVGAAVELDLRDRAVRVGPSVSVEWEAIDRWLELELGASVLAGSSGVEVPIELLFKKPFELARGVEMMVGVGPEVVYASTPAKTYFGVEGALDFMFWPSQHVGLWAEPSYDVVFENRATGSVGSTGGVIFGW